MKLILAFGYRAILGMIDMEKTLTFFLIQQQQAKNFKNGYYLNYTVKSLESSHIVHYNKVKCHQISLIPANLKN